MSRLAEDQMKLESGCNTSNSLHTMTIFGPTMIKKKAVHTSKHADKIKSGDQNCCQNSI